MENLGLRQTNEGFHIDGFPDAEKFIRLSGPSARRLADLTLHRSDLQFALECLESINKAPDDPSAIRQALWRSAIVHFAKCFGRSASRFSLDAKVIIPSGIPTEAYEYFRSIRNKHVVHDENSYAQSAVGAVLNKKDASNKIERILALSMTAETLSQDNYANLNLLANRALKWVQEQFDQLCGVMTVDLEGQAYEDLLAMPQVTQTVPTVQEVHKRRPRT